MAFAASARERLPRPADMKPDAYRAQPGGAGLRRGALPAVLGRADQRGPGDQHPHAGKADPAPEGFRVRRIAGTGRGDGRRPAPPRRIARGTPARPPNRLRPRWPAMPNRDEHAARARGDLRLWAAQNLPRRRRGHARAARGSAAAHRHAAADIVATLLYPVTDRPFRELYEMACGWSADAGAPKCWTWRWRRARGATKSCAGFRGGLYAYDMAIDIGAYRDLHRHRRCQKFRQDYSGALGFETPAAGGRSAARRDVYHAAMRQAFDDHAPAARSGPRITCCPSARARGSCSRWISPRPNTSRGCAAA